jgi:hypothetical protein
MKNRNYSGRLRSVVAIRARRLDIRRQFSENPAGAGEAEAPRMLFVPEEPVLSDSTEFAEVLSKDR